MKYLNYSEHKVYCPNKDTVWNGAISSYLKNITMKQVGHKQPEVIVTQIFFFFANENVDLLN